MTDDTRAAPTPEPSGAPDDNCPTCGRLMTECVTSDGGPAFVCFNTSCNNLVVRLPAREASSAPGWDRAADVADEFVAALAVRNRGSGTEGPRTHTDAYAAWLHLTQVLAAWRATVAALTAARTRDAELLDREYALTAHGQSLPLTGRQLLRAMADGESLAARATPRGGAS